MNSTHCDVHIDNLKAALALALPFVSKRSTLPVLSNVALQYNQNRLAVMATNLEGFITVYTDAMCDEGFAITVPAAKLNDVCALLDGVVSLTATPTDHLEIASQIVTAKASKKAGTEKKTIAQKNKLVGISLDEFPVASSTYDKVATVPSDQLVAAIERVLHASAKDESRPMLTGIYLETKDGVVILTAADGFRLAVARIDCFTYGEHALLIPARVIAELSKCIVQDGSDDVTITYSQNGVLFTVGNVEVYSALIDGKFFDYRSVIPKAEFLKAKLTIQTIDLKAALKNILAALKGQDSKKVLLDAKRDDPYLTLTAADPEVVDISILIPATLTGAKRVHTALNAKYVQDMTSILEADSLTLEFSQGGQPIIVQENSYLEVIMPMCVERDRPGVVEYSEATDE